MTEVDTTEEKLELRRSLLRARLLSEFLVETQQELMCELQRVEGLVEL